MRQNIFQITYKTFYAWLIFTLSLDEVRNVEVIFVCQHVSSPKLLDRFRSNSALEFYSKSRHMILILVYLCPI